MIDTDKYEGHDTDKRMKLLFRDNLLHIGNELSDADYHLLADAPLLLAEVKRLQNSYDMAVKQLQNTRLWITKYEGVLKEMANQAGFVKCSALNIDEWIEGVKI